MRRRDGGAGRRRDRRTGPQSGSRRPAIPGLVLVRRPRCRLATGTRAASGLRPEVLRPPARSWLIGGCNAPSESAARRRKENAAAERRKARRPASWAGHLRRSGDGSARETDHRVRRSAPAPVGALLPSIFERSGEQTKGRPPPRNGPAERWLLTTGEGARRYRNMSLATPSARLTPTEASSESGCSAIVLFEPPISAFAPMPTPSPISPLAPT